MRGSTRPARQGPDKERTAPQKSGARHAVRLRDSAAKLTARKQRNMANDQNIVPHQFKKGQSGNPKGKPAGAVSLPALLNRLLDGTITIEDAAAKLHKVTKREAIWLNVVKDALDEDGDPNVRHRAVSMIFDRTDGKPSQPMEVSGPDAQPIQIDANVPLEAKLAALAALESVLKKEE